MVPHEALLYEGIVRLLLHFGWKWVGLITLDDEGGDHFLQAMESMLSRNGICAAFKEKANGLILWDDIDFMVKFLDRNNANFLDSKANAIVVYGENGLLVWLANIIFIPTILMNPAGSEYVKRTSAGKVWITTAQADFAFSTLQKTYDIQMFHGALSFTAHSKDILGFQTFLRQIKPAWAKGDGFIEEFWEQVFECALPDSTNPTAGSELCTGEERLESVPATYFEMSMTGHSYSIYNAVYSIAHALHVLASSRATHRPMENGGSLDPLNVPPWKLHTLLQRMAFNNTVGDEVAFNERRELKGGFDITNLVTFPNKSYVRVKIGSLDPQVPPSKRVVISEDRIQWNRHLAQLPPLSLCNDHCRPGYSKEKKEGEPFCCYSCASCPEGKISDKEGSKADIAS
uniref:Uncharacterized protein n=1 Tax=Sphaerodactylus townsendi TaxID=933632 RepID=A0ACB8EWP3_9SAUR